MVEGTYSTQEASELYYRIVEGDRRTMAALRGLDVALMEWRQTGAGTYENAERLRQAIRGLHEAFAAEKRGFDELSPSLESLFRLTTQSGRFRSESQLAPAGKVKARTIELQLEEGRNPLPPPAMVHRPGAWEKADQYLSAWSKEYLSGHHGYYKTRFKITFEDGYTYMGRYNLYSWATIKEEGTEDPDLALHIRKHLEALVRSPGAYGVDEAANARDFLAKYQIGDEGS